MPRGNRSIEELQQIAIKKGCTSFNYGAAGIVYFKRFDV